MGPLAAAYSIATLAMFVVCACARMATQDADRIARAAAWVVFFTGLSRLVGYYTDPPLSMLHYPLIDYFMMMLSFGWWQVRGEWWARVLGAVFLAQCFWHAFFWWPGSDVSLYRYIYANNGFFIAELTILTLAGGGHVAVWVRDRLRLLRRGADWRLALGRPA